MKGAEATYEQELKVQKDIEVEAKEMGMEPWEMEICTCPEGTPPWFDSGEKKLRCSECLRPYRGNMGAATEASKAAKAVEASKASKSSKASKAAKAVEASKASQAAESSKSSKAKAVEEQMLANAKAKLIKGNDIGSQWRKPWKTSMISEMKGINALNLEPSLPEIPEFEKYRSRGDSEAVEYRKDIGDEEEPAQPKSPAQPERPLMISETENALNLEPAQPKSPAQPEEPAQ